MRRRISPQFRPVSGRNILLLTDIASTGFAAAENGNIQMGDSVAVFAQWPIGLCATLGAKLRGASQIFAVDSEPGAFRSRSCSGPVVRFESSAQPVEMIKALTRGRGVNVWNRSARHAGTFENALRVLKPGGTLSSAGVYSGHLGIPLDAFGAGLADQTIVTTLCPGGKERSGAAAHAPG